MIHEIRCPYCDGPMQPVKASCPGCGVAVESDFRLPRVALLSSDEAAFLAEYVLAEFSIKKMEKRVGLSYPAIRARLNRIIDSMKQLSTPDDARHEILNRLDRGELRADEAIMMIEGLQEGVL